MLPLHSLVPALQLRDTTPLRYQRERLQLRNLIELQYFNVPAGFFYYYMKDSIMEVIYTTLSHTPLSSVVSQSTPSTNSTNSECY